MYRDKRRDFSFKEMASIPDQIRLNNYNVKGDLHGLAQPLSGNILSTPFCVSFLFSFLSWTTLLRVNLILFIFSSLLDQSLLERPNSTAFHFRP